MPYEDARWFETGIEIINSVEERLRRKLAVLGKEVKWNPGDSHPRVVHIHAAAQQGEWDADAGYTLVDRWDLKVVWTPDLPHPVDNHTVSSQSEGQWVPEDGYIRVDSGSSKGAIVWAPHQSNHLYPHITSQAEEGKWMPDPGYSFTNQGQDLKVVWTPNLPDPAHAHVVSSKDEGKWLPDDGYSWANPISSDLAVVWKPRTTSRFHPHLTSQADEGEWLPDPGYQFVSFGLAVPSNIVRSIMGQLVVGHGWLGVTIQKLTPELASQFGISETKGVFVSEVMDNSPAQKAGFERGDVIVKYASQSMDSPTHLQTAVSQTPAGKNIAITFIRNKKLKTIHLTIVEQPKSMSQIVKIVWVPGQPDPAHAHLVADTVEGKWAREDGYDWVDATKYGSSLVWKPNSKSRLHPHVLTGKEEGDWVAEPGYQFVNPKSKDVVWIPQSPHPVLPHLLAGNREGDWDAEPGYHLDHDNNGNIVLKEGPEPSIGASNGGSSFLGACAKGSARYILRDILIQIGAGVLDAMGCGGICSKVAVVWTVPDTVATLAKGCAFGVSNHMTGG